MKRNNIQIEYMGSIGEQDIYMIIAKELKKIFLANRYDDKITMKDNLIERSDLNSTEYALSKIIISAIYDDQGDSETRDITSYVQSADIEEVDLRAFGHKYNFLENNDMTISEEGVVQISIKCLTYFNYVGMNFLREEGGEE